RFSWQDASGPLKESASWAGKRQLCRTSGYSQERRTARPPGTAAGGGLKPISVKGRQWHCRNPQCSFQGHRDVVGSVNMHPLAFGTKIAFPAHITYQRAGPVRVLAGTNNHARCTAVRPL